MAESFISTYHNAMNAVYYGQSISSSAYPATVGASGGRSLPTTSCLLYSADGAPNYSSLLQIAVLKDSLTAGSGATTIRLVGYSKAVFGLPSDTVFVPNILAEFTLTATTGTEVELNFGSAGAYYAFSGMSQTSGTPAANIFSPVTNAATNTDPAFAVVDTMGAQYVYAQIKSAATTMAPVILWKQF